MANLKFIILQYSYVHFVSCLQHHNSSVHCFLEANVLSDLTQMDFFFKHHITQMLFFSSTQTPWNPPSTNTILSVAHCGDFWSLKCFVKGHHNGGSKGGGGSLDHCCPPRDNKTFRNKSGIKYSLRK